MNQDNNSNNNQNTSNNIQQPVNNNFQQANQNLYNGFQQTNQNSQPIGYFDPTMYGSIQQNSFPDSASNSQVNSATNVYEPKKKKFPFVIIAIVVAVVALVGSVFLEMNNSNKNSNSLADKKILIAYFSRDGENYGANLSSKVNLDKGNTELMAEKIQSFIGGDLYKIEPTVAYPENLTELYSQTKKELNNDYYPEILNSVNLSSYDIIFIGYPIWHQNYPQIIKTFVRDNPSLKDKIIIPFVTHAGSGSSGTYKKLQNIIGVSDNNFYDGLDMNGTKVSESDDKIKDWLERIGFEINK